MSNQPIKLIVTLLFLLDHGDLNIGLLFHLVSIMFLLVLLIKEDTREIPLMHVKVNRVFILLVLLLLYKLLQLLIFLLVVIIKAPQR